jgi:hypothetical protein
MFKNVKKRQNNVGNEMGIEGDMKIQRIRNKLKPCKVIIFTGNRYKNIL